MFITKNKERIFYSLLGPLFLILLWVALNKFNLISPLYLPPLEEVVRKIEDFLLNGGFYSIYITFYRAFLSLIIAGIFAIPLGLILGSSKKAYSFSEVIIDFFRSVPATAFFPLFLLFFGVGDLAKIAISSFVCFWILLINTIYGVWESSDMRLKIAKIFKVSRYNLFTKIILFEALPQIMIGIRLGISISLIITIVAEMFVGAQYGLGKVIYDSYVSYDMAQLFSMILIVGILGYAVNKLFVAVERKTVHWVGK